MEVEAFDYILPEELIAQTPLADRTSSRLMTLNKQSGEVRHQHFADIIHDLKAGDLLVMNDTRVIPARLFGVKKDTGAKVEVLLLKSFGEDRWEALVKPGKRIRSGATLVFGDKLEAIVEESGEMGSRILKFQYNGIFNEILDELGHMPLPPYIKEVLDEKDRYQTVYAKHEGSAAAPTAGLHFTNELMQAIKDKGVQIAYITLHVGLGTFRPVSVDRIEDHAMHAEYFDVPEETAAAINETKKNGGRVMAVGTTSSRTLETAARVSSAKQDGEQSTNSDSPSTGYRPITSCSGWTDIFIFPGYQFQVVDALITNFHLPKSTLLMLISAMATREHVMQAYEEAVKERYRFFSFGDAMFIY
ncbi:tRNA preQ1(34) S-adenosylmethionine ribosyltransferase-isomerase QueA [Paenibacillus sp. N1-5-1-14]|uniref:tRNA preQ1(34) S-adenosylmethionine ribosyltransferase-isomerase QueA n=1 Tax=Paenibacillus radicibacter TaxID=2972488 RepID=UPI0021590C7E|nr:tRNA preQ1(34) S-adenosylmethionine ribosyltransferase-isomerase QueA [Paenibacillus radicibacter]MCR8644115.1 tRNA preQ1(34) S-adenosylmethionine ribosyltransferase-isomerase QueA [Paenibacillus radicibacter]